ncbi:Os01g0682400 [Oryza sativa Japonica Group]|uniref:Os01g0682400 protein n=1 Tax=Oryza sativa subsp. japonica TaxID=39947 RepID=A0A0N7KDI6_ORYSJ|nr:Os01g0682400 [Oryza sativa Japonica Group]
MPMESSGSGSHQRFSRLGKGCGSGEVAWWARRADAAWPGLRGGGGGGGEKASEAGGEGKLLRPTCSPEVGGGCRRVVAGGSPPRWRSRRTGE